MNDILIGMIGVGFTFFCSIGVIWLCTSELHNLIKNKPLRIFAWIAIAFCIAFANISSGYFAWEVSTQTLPIDYD